MKQEKRTNVKIRERVNRLYSIGEVNNIEDRKQVARQRQTYNTEIDDLIYVTREEIKEYRAKEQERKIEHQQDRGMSR